MTKTLLKSAFCATLTFVSVQGCSAASSSNSSTSKLSGYVSKLVQSKRQIIEIEGMRVDPEYLVYMLAYNKALSRAKRAYDVQYYLKQGKTRVIGRNDLSLQNQPSFEDCIVFSHKLYDALSKTLFMLPLESEKLEIIEHSTQKHQLQDQAVHVEPIKPSISSESLGIHSSENIY